MFDALGCFHHFCPCQEARLPLTGEGIERGRQKKNSTKQQKGCTVIKAWECEWWRLYKTNTNVKQHFRENFPCRRSLTDHQFLEEIKSRKLFGYVQCDIEVPANLRANFANFPPIFKNTLVWENDTEDIIKTYAEEKGLMSQARKILISSFTVQNGTLITPLLLFDLQLALFSRKLHRFPFC